MPKKYTQQDFINKSISIFGTLYDYSKVDYINSRTPIILICRYHGQFNVIPKDHLCYKRGCILCSGVRYNKDTFIQKSISIHGNRYDYNKAIFKDVKTKVKIICPIHGIFLQTPDKHINSSQGCKKCAGTDKKDLMYVIEKGNAIHNNKYDYSLAKFVDMATKIDIICPVHGAFQQTPNNHIIGEQDCQKCMYEADRLTVGEFIEKSINFHGQKYDYSKVVYVNSLTKVEIICSEHGSFWQKPHGHIGGNGCPKCIGPISKIEQEWLDLLNIPNEYRNKTIYTEMGRFSVDAIDSMTNTIYEFYGDYWHGNPKIYDLKQINKHNKIPFSELYNATLERESKLIKLGYKIISIWEDDFKRQRRR